MALDPQRAFVLGRRWDLLAWNRAANVVFDIDQEMPRHSRNLFWRLLTKPSIRHYPEWERHLGFVVSQFRADAARDPGDHGTVK